MTPRSPSPRPRLYSNGQHLWLVTTLWAAAEGLPAQDLPVATLAKLPELDEVCWFSDAWGKRPTCRAIIDHARRIRDADLSYPIILGPNNELLDGMHRIAKAMLDGHATIRAVRLPAMPPPDESLRADDPRYEAPSPGA
jgi:hypothetical protein